MVMPARQEPRVETEPHGGPPAVRGPDGLRPDPAELFEALSGSRAAGTRATATRPRDAGSVPAQSSPLARFRARGHLSRSHLLGDSSPEDRDPYTFPINRDLTTE